MRFVIRNGNYRDEREIPPSVVIGLRWHSQADWCHLRGRSTWPPLWSGLAPRTAVGRATPMISRGGVAPRNNSKSAFRGCKVGVGNERVTNKYTVRKFSAMGGRQKLQQSMWFPERPAKSLWARGSWFSSTEGACRVIFYSRSGSWLVTKLTIIVVISSCRSSGAFRYRE